MKKIEGIIVVEGKNDSKHLKSFFECETIETGGAHLKQETIDCLKLLAKHKDIILLLDPDTPGEQIRNRLNKEIPNLKNCFLNKKDAIGKHKVGVEHASYDALAHALSAYIINDIVRQEYINRYDLYELGLCGKNNSKSLRNKLAKYYPIGDCSPNKLYKRLNMLGLKKEDIAKLL